MNIRKRPDRLAWESRLNDRPIGRQIKDAGWPEERSVYGNLATPLTTKLVSRDCSSLSPRSGCVERPKDGKPLVTETNSKAGGGFVRPNWVWKGLPRVGKCHGDLI